VVQRSWSATEELTDFKSFEFKRNIYIYEKRCMERVIKLQKMSVDSSVPAMQFSSRCPEIIDSDEA
jgi:hypothetical protein